MASPFRRLFRPKQEERMLAFHAKYFARMEETRPEDVFIAGYPKSGNTWFQNLVCGLVFGVLPNVGPERVAIDLVPDVHEQKRYYRRYQTPTYFKTHHLPKPEYRNVVYLLRDGRDVMVSYWHYLQERQKKTLDFLELVRSGEELYPCRWQEHVRQWQANPHQARMLVIKYEDLLADPAAQLERFCAFCGIAAERPLLELVAGAASFQNLQSREKREIAAGIMAPKEKLFYRRGVKGSYQDEMPPEVLAEFMAQAGPMLAEMGYG